MSDDPFTPAELEKAAMALAGAGLRRGITETDEHKARAVLSAVVPLITARLRAEAFEEIAQVCDAYALRLHGTAATVMREGAQHAAAIVRAHRTKGNRKGGKDG